VVGGWDTAAADRPDQTQRQLIARANRLGLSRPPRPPAEPKPAKVKPPKVKPPSPFKAVKPPKTRKNFAWTQEYRDYLAAYYPTTRTRILEEAAKKQ
jgi:hypothetical protein